MPYLQRHALSGSGILALGVCLVGDIKRHKDDDRGSKRLHGETYADQFRIVSPVPDSGSGFPQTSHSRKTTPPPSQMMPGGGALELEIAMPQ
jgi:hypothetical protein